METFSLSRHRIVTAGSEWVTPPDSAECEPATSERTMALECFDGVGRATRIITARRRKQGTERYLVRTHEYNEKRSHQVSLDPASAGLPADGDGCWLEVAPFAVDSLRVQILCRYPAPGHHLGVVDARLPLRGDSVVYERSFAGDTCRIHVRFAGARANVAQEGSDRACGFGASVDVSGTYRRLAKRRPSFDLAPIERSSAPRPPLE